MYDLIIIGSGPIGMACGIEAEKHNLKYIILEKGCLVNSIYSYPTNMMFFSTSEKLEIGEVPFISHTPKPTRTEALEYYRRVKSAWNLKVNVYEKVKSINGEVGNFNVISDKQQYKTKYVIIATGFFDKANLLNVDGEELEKVRHYYTEPHPYIDQSLLVIGGGNSAVDVALETFRRGAKVTMVLNKNKFENNVKYWVKPDIENRVEEGSIKTYFQSQVLEIRDNEVDIETPDGVVTIQNDFVLAMTGYHPDFDFLENAGIELKNVENIPKYNSETFETNIPGLFIAGVVCGGKKTNIWFIENSRYHAENILNYIMRSLL